MIVCTDGVANLGLGDLEEMNDLDFYERVGEIAQAKGVEISVISISDEDCRLDALSKLVESTGGDLSKVNPHRLSEDFASILANEVFATNTRVTVRLAKGLEFVNQDSKDLVAPGVLEKNIGNVNNESIFTFEFKVGEDGGKSAPVQVVIEYKDMVGNRMVMVHTEEFEISEDHNEVIKDADFSIFAKNAQLQCGNLIKNGNLRGASDNIEKWTMMMSSNSSSAPQMNSLEAMIQRTTPLQQKINENMGMGYEPPNPYAQNRFCVPPPSVMRYPPPDFAGNSEYLPVPGPPRIQQYNPVPGYAPNNESEYLVGGMGMGRIPQNPLIPQNYYNSASSNLDSGMSRKIQSSLSVPNARSGNTVSRVSDDLLSEANKLSKGGKN